jgi:hypothetical protein
VWHEHLYEHAKKSRDTTFSEFCSKCRQMTRDLDLTSTLSH